MADPVSPKELLPDRLRKPRLRRDEVVEYLALVYGVNISKKTLANYASDGRGPRFDKGAPLRELYVRTEIDRWVSDRLKPSKSSQLEMESVVTHVKSQPAVRQPNIDEMALIFKKLDECFEDGLYLDGWSDQKIGASLGLPWAMVALVREKMRGPIKEDPAVKALRSDLESWMSMGAELKTRLDKLAG